jgi:hypothetical protein
VAWFLKQILTGKIRPEGILEVEPEAVDPNATAQK